MADTVAETARLILRTWRESDFADWSAHLNTPEVRVHLGGVLSDDRAREVFTRLLATWDREGHGFLAIERKADGALIGSCGTGPIDTETAPPELRGGYEVGYSLRADARGQGHATEAATAIVEMIFERFDQPVAYAQTSQANRGSWRVMQRLGMTRRADLDYDDPAYEAEENPTMVWSLAREDRAA
ncbi:N-acetyltransferase [Croceicoccus ponticola]|uniref:N-acetyltransferase n=1 Tax=Croceicoccus ponticola TaxID=2217664 RepID=A0A437GYH6_9SPHN|nr:GNAT family N-acetyltransferase [Croceicoccus ponticola]RVQ67727.1 N-acetyltransferase [Croceicoccus ponticola]